MKLSMMKENVLDLLKAQKRPIWEVGLAYFMEMDRESFKETIESLEKEGLVKKSMKKDNVYWEAV